MVEYFEYVKNAKVYKLQTKHVFSIGSWSHHPILE